jgi:nitroreductase
MIKKLVGWIKRKREYFLKFTLPRVFSGSIWKSSCYYFFFHSGFQRELRSVLEGKIRHLNQTRSKGENQFMLVRNTHRLEKALLMRPRKAVFALDYIGETMDCFVALSANKVADFNEGQLKWSTDVLNEYFSVISSNPVLDLQKKRFLEISSERQLFKEEDVLKYIPYKRSETEFSTIEFDEFYKLCKQRRSVRWFMDKAVPRELIDQAILAALESPSACNRQPFSFRIFDDSDKLAQVVEFPMGTKGYAHNIKTFIVVVGHLDAYFDERDRHLIYIDASLANMTLMLALETLGLGSCPINWPEIESREKLMENFLDLKPWERPIMCIGVGYPDPEGKVAFSKKRELSLIRTYN